MIRPNQRFKVAWDILILHIILYYFLVIPLQLSFDFIHEEMFSSWMITLVGNHYLSDFIVFIPEILLIFDSLLKLITGYYENGIVITSKKHIVSHYLRKGLIFDLLSYCPVVFQSLFYQSSIGLKISQFLMFLKVKRIKIIVDNFQEIISLKGQNNHILSLIKLIIQIIFFAHINACIWHFVGYYNSNNPTWLEFSGIKDMAWMSKYFYSFYWAVGCLVTIGSGDRFGPQNDLELITATVIFLISSIYFGFNLNSLREIFEQMNKKEKNYK